MTAPTPPHAREVAEEREDGSVRTVSALFIEMGFTEGPAQRRLKWAWAWTIGIHFLLFAVVVPTSGTADFAFDKAEATVIRRYKPPEIERPNGIVISPDDKTLYLIEAHIAEGGARMIRAYDLQPNGTVTNMRVFYNFYPGRSGDGMTVDSEGNLYVAAGLNLSRGTAETMDTKPGIHVISPEGKLLHYIPILEDLITNCAFGGPDMQTLYVTAGKTLFRVRTQIPGTGR